MGIGLDILHPVTIVPMGGANVGSGSGEPIIVNLDYMQDTAPSNPQEKQVWYDTANDEIYTYKNGQWIENDPSVGVWYKFGDKYYLWDGDSLEETDLNIYEKIENKTSNFDTQSLITYPNSKALYDALQSQLATLTVFENNTGTVLETGLTLGNSVLVFINGSLLEAGAEADYIINGNQIIFSIPLQSTDKVTVINGILKAIDLSPYQLKLGASNVITIGEGNVVDGVSADGGTVTVTKNTTLSTVATSGDYNDLSNKPSINGVTLSGNKTSNQLELQNMSIEVQNSGDELPSDTTGYNLGDKFLNKTDKKVYEVSNEYTLNSGVNTNGLTINYTTGEVSGFDYAYYINRNFGSYNYLWSGNKNYTVKFKLTTLNNGGGIISFHNENGQGQGDIIAFSVDVDNKIYYSHYTRDFGSYVILSKELLFNETLSANKEYVLNINKIDNICNVELVSDSQIINTGQFSTQDITTYTQQCTISFGSGVLTNTPLYLSGSIYLLESSGDFLTSTGNVVWNSGTALVNNTQYIDVNKDILWLFNNNELMPYSQDPSIIINDSATITDLAIQANKVYKFTNANITNISFASCEQSELVTKIDFTTGSSNVTFSDGNVINWADGETPHFYAYQHYWIIISNGVGFVKEIY
jgi:hypothetical protein